MAPGAPGPSGASGGAGAPTPPKTPSQGGKDGSSGARRPLQVLEPMHPGVHQAPTPGAQPPSYTEAVGGVYATTPMGFYNPSAPTNSKGTPPTVVPIVTAVVPLGPNSTRTICPYCHAQISTETKTKPGVIAYLSGALIALFGCWLGCCLIPCCIDDCMDTHHTCPECKAYLGRYKKL